MLPRLIPTFLAWHMWHRVRVQRAISTKQTIITMDITTITSVIFPAVEAATKAAARRKLMLMSSYRSGRVGGFQGGSVCRFTLLAGITVLPAGEEEECDEKKLR